MIRRLLAAGLAFTVLGCPLFGGGSGACPGDMAQVVPEDKSRAYCIDRWEAGVVEIQGDDEVPHSPFETVTKLKVKAVSRPGEIPQAYISKNEAEEACRNAHKRLCTREEWQRACYGGRKPSTYPYGAERKSGYCNDDGRANVVAYTRMNDPRINQQPDTVARTGEHERCTNAYGVFDMVGNLHEWTAEVHPYAGGSKGVFRGGYYQDTNQNGVGCNYKTTVHDVGYHDYSTGFRCCADPR
jgi:formylglycine-generating enzyme required for sulfatase activity